MSSPILLVLALVVLSFGADVNITVSCTNCPVSWAITNSSAVDLQNPTIYCALGDVINFNLTASLNNNGTHIWAIQAGGNTIAISGQSNISIFPASQQLPCDQTLCDAGALTYKCLTHPAMVGQIVIEGCATPTPTPTPASTWLSTYQFASSCNSQNLRQISSIPSPCVTGTTGACTCVNGVCTQSDCTADLPATPSDFIVYSKFNNEDCTGDPYVWTATTSKYCLPDSNTALSSSTAYYCSNFGLVIFTWPNRACLGVPLIQPSAIPAGCYNDSGKALFTSCVPPCFHEDTKITYEGKEISLASVRAGAEVPCVVPHAQPSAAGVKISTSCGGEPLRVTHEHLVFTDKGLKAAGDVKMGDTVYQGDAELPCIVTSVVGEVGKYFGLNCEESVVRANGYKVSTFGISHQIPALWMKYASKVLGINCASYVGDLFAQVLSAVGLI